MWRSSLNIVIFFSSSNDSCASEEFSFRDHGPTSPSREEVKAQAFDRLQEELKKAQEVRSFASIFVIF